VSIHEGCGVTISVWPRRFRRRRSSSPVTMRLAPAAGAHSTEV
jgi:hypothetical protein